MRGASRRRTAALLKELGDPQNQVRTIHVAGTAGKGSVTAFTASILRSHGFHVGAYLSPHVHTVLERFQIDGTPASLPVVATALDAVRATAQEVAGGPGTHSMFETATAAAFQLFREQDVDYAVIETGVGGQYDATNTITRTDKLAVVTAIGMDHTEVLGNSLPEIAAQKAGILPPGGAGIAIRTTAESDRVIAAAASARRCCLRLVGHDEAVRSLPEDVQPTMLGVHQRVNAGLAILAAEYLASRDGWSLEPDRISEGVLGTVLPGRFEPRRWQGHPIVLDGAHNAIKIAALRDTVRTHWPARAPVWVVSLKAGKHIDGALAEIAAMSSTVVATEFDVTDRNSSRGLPVSADRLAAYATSAGLRAVASSHLATALDCAVELSETDVPVIVAGSFYLAADAGKLALS